MLLVNRHTITHTLNNIYHIPDAPSCLVSASCFESIGGHFTVYKEKLILYNTLGAIVDYANQNSRLYMMITAILPTILAVHLPSWED